MSSIKDLPVGTQSFAVLINDNLLYIDKTQLIHQLVTSGRVYFLSRPRRFGKSLLVSTLEALFKGKKELFKGLYIERTDWQWQEDPVIRLDMSLVLSESLELFDQSLKEILLFVAKNYKIDLQNKHEPALMLAQLIDCLSKDNKKVVVLIDEYDKPIINQITNTEHAGKIRARLRDFYSVIKGYDHLIKFVLLTGVTKFTKTSIFSGLNNLEDITLDRKYSSLVGLTEEELDIYLNKHFVQMSSKLGTTVEQLRKKFKHYYNGYKMSDGPTKIYNPFSVLSALKQNFIRNYWFSTGTPTFLMQLIEKEKFNFTNLSEQKISADKAFSGFDIEQLPLIQLMLQTGYLTIDQYIARRNTYTLKIPNYEVDSALNEYIYDYFISSKAGETSLFLDNIIDALEEELDFTTVIENLKSLIACLPFELFIREERYYHSLVFIIFKMAGLKVNAELHSFRGKADMVLELEDAVVIIELKLDKTAKVGIQQILDKEYFRPYITLDKPVHLLALNFSSKKKNVTDWKHMLADKIPVDV